MPKINRHLFLSIIMHLFIKVKSNSKKNEILKDGSGNITLKIKAQAKDGKANEEIYNFLSEILKIPKNRIEILSGFTNPYKKLNIDLEELTVKEIFSLL